MAKLLVYNERAAQSGPIPNTPSEACRFRQDAEADGVPDADFAAEVSFPGR